MDEREWGHATWTALAAAGLGRGGSREIENDSAFRPPVVALLPVGAVEAHGPHLPLAADVIIAQAAVHAALAELDALGFRPLALPPLAYAAAPFAAEFPGTISIRPETVSALVSDIAAALARQGVAAMVVVNAHLDPAHLASLRQGVADCEGPDGAGEPSERVMPVIFPDVTRKPWALRLTDEFKSGACHAGQYESSVVMAAAPALVREDARRALPPRPISLSLAHRNGAATFGEAGVPEAYCGDPAAATPEEGAETLGILGRIVADAVAERLGVAGACRASRPPGSNADEGAAKAVEPAATRCRARAPRSRSNDDGAARAVEPRSGIGACGPRRDANDDGAAKAVEPAPAGGRVGSLEPQPERLP